MLVPIHSVRALTHVDTEIFSLTYFGECMKCHFCKDSCCQYGCDVNLHEREKILSHADALESFTNTKRESWFTDDVVYDEEYPSGAFVRSKTRNGRCVFLNSNGRGCMIHAYALKKNIDYHELKPMVCWLFPVTYDKGILRPNCDVKDDLVCANSGNSLYHSTRGELQQYFGVKLVDELDGIFEKMKNSPGLDIRKNE